MAKERVVSNKKRSEKYMSPGAAKASDTYGAISFFSAIIAFLFILVGYSAQAEHASKPRTGTFADWDLTSGIYSGLGMTSVWISILAAIFVLVIVLKSATVKSDRATIRLRHDRNGGIATASIGALVSLALIVFNLPLFLREQFIEDVVHRIELMTPDGRDNAQKRDLIGLAHDVRTELQSDRRLIAVEEFNTTYNDIIKKVKTEGDPTETEALYTQGKDCEGKESKFKFSLNIRRASDQSINCLDWYRDPAFDPPSLEKQDEYRKSDLRYLVDDAFTYIYVGPTKGHLPGVMDFSTDYLDIIKSIKTEGEPTAEGALYVPGQNCKGGISNLTYSFKIKMLKDNTITCVDYYS